MQRQQTQELANGIQPIITTSLTASEVNSQARGLPRGHQGVSNSNNSVDATRVHNIACDASLFLCVQAPINDCLIGCCCPCVLFATSRIQGGLSQAYFASIALYLAPIASALLVERIFLGRLLASELEARHVEVEWCGTNGCWLRRDCAFDAQSPVLCTDSYTWFGNQAASSAQQLKIARYILLFTCAVALGMILGQNRTALHRRLGKRKQGHVQIWLNHLLHISSWFATFLCYHVVSLPLFNSLIWRSNTIEAVSFCGCWMVSWLSACGQCQESRAVSERWRANGHNPLGTTDSDVQMPLQTTVNRSKVVQGELIGEIVWLDVPNGTTLETVASSTRVTPVPQDAQGRSQYTSTSTWSGNFDTMLRPEIQSGVLLEATHSGADEEDDI